MFFSSIFQISFYRIAVQITVVLFDPCRSVRATIWDRFSILLPGKHPNAEVALISNQTSLISFIHTIEGWTLSIAIFY